MGGKELYVPNSPWGGLRALIPGPRGSPQGWRGAGEGYPGGGLVGGHRDGGPGMTWCLDPSNRGQPMRRRRVKHSPSNPSQSWPRRRRMRCPSNPSQPRHCRRCPSNPSQPRRRGDAAQATGVSQGAAQATGVSQGAAQRARSTEGAAGAEGLWGRRRAGEEVSGGHPVAGLQRGTRWCRFR